MAPEESADTDFGVISLAMWLKVKEVNSVWTKGHGKPLGHSDIYVGDDVILLPTIPLNAENRSGQNACR